MFDERASRRVPLGGVPLAWLAALILYVALTTTDIVTGRAAEWLSDMAWTLAAAIATWTTWRTSRQLPIEQRRGWQLFAGGCLIWLMGQFVWDWNELVRHIQVPFPSIGDVGFTLFGLAFVAGLLSLRTVHLRSPLSQQRIANLALIICSLAAVFSALILHPIARSQHSIEFIAIALLESLSVLVAFVIAIYLIWSYRWNDELSALILVALGLLCQTISFVIYAHQLLLDQFNATSFINVGWLAAFGFQHWAATVQANAQRSRSTQSALHLSGEGWIEALMPGLLLLFIALALVSLVYYLSPVVIVVTAVLLGVFAVILAFREASMFHRGEQVRADLARVTSSLESARLDIRHIEQQRAQLQRDLQFTARSGGMGMWDWSLPTNAMVLSPEWKRQLGYEDHEIPNAIEEWYSRIHPDDKELAFAARDSYLAAPTGDLSFELRLLHRDGSYRWFLAQATALTDGSGQVVRLLGSHVNITTRKAAEVALRESEARYRELADALEVRIVERTAALMEAYRESQNFAHAVAHDLKTPLRAIEGFSHLLAQSAQDRLTGEEHGFVLRVRRGALQMAALIDDLLDYSRMEHLEMRIEPLQLDAFLGDLLATLSEELAGIQVELQIDTPSVRVCADRQGLSIALRNIIENAGKFSRATTVPRIEVGARSQDCNVLLWIKDNGIGFEQIYHEKIFEIFQRLHRNDDYPGTGIGLALARKAMQRMKGRIWAVSAPDQGATFYLELPAPERSLAVADGIRR